MAAAPAWPANESGSLARRRSSDHLEQPLEPLRPLMRELPLPPLEPPPLPPSVASATAQGSGSNVRTVCEQLF